MKILLIALMTLPLSLYAQDTPEYMRNDGLAAPETLDRAVEEGQIQREEAEDIQEEEDEVLERSDFGLPETRSVEEELSPDADAQLMQEEEEKRVDDNYLIGPYNGKGEFDLPQKEEEAIKKDQEEVTP